MSQWNVGDRVQVKGRTPTEEDRKKGRYYEHMAGLIGTIENVYSDTEIAVRVDPETLNPVTAGVHQTATLRMREKFAGSITEELRKSLTKEEMEFDPHFVLLVQGSDLQKA